MMGAQSHGCRIPIGWQEAPLRSPPPPLPPPGVKRTGLIWDYTAQWRRLHGGARLRDTFGLHGLRGEEEHNDDPETFTFQRKSL